MSLKKKGNGMHPDHIQLAQKIKDEAAGSNGFVRKKEVEDCSSTLAQVGDYTRKSCTVRRTIESMFQRRRSIKIENSNEDVVCLEKEPTCSSILQELENSKSAPRLSKKEENEDNISMIVHFDPPSSSSPSSSCTFTKSQNKVGSHIKKVEFDRDTVDNVSLLSVTNSVMPGPSNPIPSSSLSLVSSKVLAKRRSLFESSKSQKYNHVLADSNASKTFDGLPANFIQKSTNTKSSGFMKKEKIDDNLSTMVIHDLTPPASPNLILKISRITIESHVTTVDFDKNVLDSRNTVPLVSAGSAVSSGASKAIINQAGLIESNKIQKTISGFEQNERADWDMTMPNDGNGANKRSVWELDAESENSLDDLNSEEDCNESGSDMDIEEGTTAETNDSSKRDKLACLDCPTVFKTEKAFSLHIGSHKGYRKFKCEVCKKRFSQSGHLETHKRIHTGDRPFKCDVCEKRFSRKDVLKDHIRIHTDERLFKCSLCDKPFKLRQALRRHEFSHTGKKPFECPDCKKCFSRKGTLREHQLIHTGGKPCKCLTCGKCFRYTCNLNRHKRTHTDLDTHNISDVVQHSVDQLSTVASYSLSNDSTTGQKIRYRSKSIDYIVEKMATRNRNIVYLVWSKKFTMDLASAVARSGYNCLLCVKKFLPASFPDVLNLSNTVQTSVIEIGPDAKKLRLFSFVGMVIPEKIGRHGRLKSLDKLESKLAKFSRSQGMELVNIFKHAENKIGWYESLRRDLKEDCIITDKS